MNARTPERGSVSPVLVLLVVVLGAIIVAVFRLPEALRASPSIGAIAAHTPVWLKVATIAAVYVLPVASAPLHWEGFSDQQSPLEKLVEAARAFTFAPGGAVGALYGGTLWWMLGGIVGGIVAGLVIAALLRVALGRRTPDQDRSGDAGST